MSYDVSLWISDDKIAQVERHQEGGTYAVGGVTDANISITYNYAFFFYHFLEGDEGMRGLHGKVAKDTIASLEKAVDVLGTKQWKDYWAPTPGNAGYALNVLLTWARQHPTATWRVS